MSDPNNPWQPPSSPTPPPPPAPAPAQQWAPTPGPAPQPYAPQPAPGWSAATTSPHGELPPGVDYASPWMRLGARIVESLLIAVTLGIGWTIWALAIGGDGQTPAKKLLGLRVVNADSRQPTGLGSMFRMRGLVAGWVVSFVAVITLGIILFMPFWDDRNQNLWDKVSNTYVVTDPHNAWHR
ncbi:hypothetical protein BH24ACT5_BH24ACT5_30700 [soil metagenome]